MKDFMVPQPATVIAPNLPGDADYDSAHTTGPGAIAQRRMAVLYDELAEVVAERSAAIVYAGDCLSVIGVLAGLQRRAIDPTLYWFDAHGDFHTWETTSSQFLGGMPLAMLTGRGEQTIPEHVGLTPVTDERVVLVDARDLEPLEDVAVDRSHMTVTAVRDVATNRPAAGPIYVHIDVDVVDPQDLPAVNYPAPHGPSVREVRDAVSQLAATGRVVAVSVSSWNPALPGADEAAAATRAIVDVFLDPPRLPPTMLVS
ncbi:MAG: arginase family protein [Acidimicrobiia bacterium]